MITVDLFGCTPEQILACSFDEACDRFPCTGITMPDASALFSLSEILTGSRAFSAQPVALSTEPFYAFPDVLTAAIRAATADDLMDAGAQWAQSSPWRQRDTNPMDLAGFLLHLQSLVNGPGREENAIFLAVESKQMMGSSK